MSVAYNDLAARLRTIVSEMNDTDIAELEEQTDFIESIKTFLKKHDSRSLQALGQRLQEYSIIDLAELDKETLQGYSSNQTIEEQWASFLGSPQDASSAGSNQDEAYLMSSPSKWPQSRDQNLSNSMQTTLPLNMAPGIGEDWNFLDTGSMQNTTYSMNLIDDPPPTQRGDSFGSSVDSHSQMSYPSSYSHDLMYEMEDPGKADPLSPPSIVINDLLGDFTRSGQPGLARAKAEEVVQAAKSIIRGDLQQFLNTFLPLWQTQGLWGNTNVDLLVGSGTSHERLESAYRCLTCLGLRMADDPVRSRMASIVLHREFHAACTMLKEKGPSRRTTAQRGRGLATPVIDYTLRQIHKNFDQLAVTRQKELRAEFHDNKRFGKRWERLARSLGYGILIVCSKAVNAVIKKTTFTDAMLDGLAYTVKRHIPECSKLIAALDSVAVSLLKNTPMNTTLDSVIIEHRISSYFSRAVENNMLSMTMEGL